MNLWLRVVLLVSLVHCISAQSDVTDNQALKYLKTYGYMKQDDGVDKLSEGLKAFQKFAGIEETGNLDTETKAYIGKPRCGVLDEKNENYLNEDENKITEKKWDKNELTYRIKNYHKSLNKDAVNKDMKDALGIWAKYGNLKFTELKKDADIDISFESGDHGDGIPFVSGDGIIAHAFGPGPELGGDVHFNNDAEWETGDKADGTNLYSVAAHNFGHSLGMKHSDNKDSIMFPIYKTKDFKKDLHEDDIKSIQAVYGKPENKSDIPLCQIDKIGTIFRTGNGNKLVFKGNQYWKLPRKRFSHYPQNISDHIVEIPVDIDAAFSTRDNDTYYFKDDSVWKYRGRKLYQDFPKNISVEFPGIPNNIDTVFRWEKTNKLFFFKGNEAWGFEYLKSPYVDSKYPVNITSWGIPTPFDGALTFRGRIYIFKDDSYYSLNLNKKIVEPGYPKSTLERWFHC